MQIAVDNVWSSPTTLHLRVCVWIRPNYRCIKQDVSIALADIEGLARVVNVALVDQPVREVIEAEDVPLF